MTENTRERPPVWFWIVSALALVWNGMGVGNFIWQATATPEALVEAMGQAGAEMSMSQPVWAVVLFGVAVIGGALGCLCLLLRRRIAFWLLLASALAVGAQQVYWWAGLGLGKTLSGGAWVMPIMIPVIAVLLLWLARTAASKSWLR